jgi:hypothetical protein
MTRARQAAAAALCLLAVAAVLAGVRRLPTQAALEDALFRGLSPDSPTSCAVALSRVAGHDDIRVAIQYPGGMRSLWQPLTEAMRDPAVFPQLRHRRSCAIVGSHPRAMASLAAHRGTVARAEAVVLMNKANCSEVQRLLGRPATHVALNRNCGNDRKPCGVGCGAAAMMTVHDHWNLTGFEGLLYEGATRRTSKFTPSHGHAILRSSSTCATTCRWWASPAPARRTFRRTTTQASTGSGCTISAWRGRCARQSRAASTSRGWPYSTAEPRTRERMHGIA